MNKEGLPYTLLFAFISTFIFVVPLSIAHNATKDLVEQNGKLALQRSVAYAFGILDPANNPSPELIRSTYAKVTVSEVEGTTVYTYIDNSNTYYAGQFTSPGLWGPIDAIVSFDANFEKVISFAVISHAETPGLGARITEPWFIQQAKGERFNPDGVILLNAFPKNRANKDDGALDAITGATRTSDAIAQLFRESRAKMIQLLGRQQ